MRKLMIKCMIFFLCVLIFEGFASDCICNVNALSIRKEQTRVYLFAVPNGGWSSCRVNIVYTEEYTHSSLSHRNTFYQRTKWYTGEYVYALTCPVLLVCEAVIKSGAGNVIHTYTDWSSEPSIFPGNMNIYGCYKNTESFQIGDTNDTTGQVNYTVVCFGATPSAYFDSIVMSLRTN